LLWFAGREALKQLKKDFDKTEDDLKSLHSVGQITREVLRHSVRTSKQFDRASIEVRDCVGRADAHVVLSMLKT
jgi:hypothetical protein